MKINVIGVSSGFGNIRDSYFFSEDLENHEYVESENFTFDLPDDWTKTQNTLGETILTSPDGYTTTSHDISAESIDDSNNKSIVTMNSYKYTDKGLDVKFFCFPIVEEDKKNAIKTYVNSLNDSTKTTEPQKEEEIE